MDYVGSYGMMKFGMVTQAAEAVLAGQPCPILRAGSSVPKVFGTLPTLERFDHTAKKSGIICGEGACF